MSNLNDFFKDKDLKIFRDIIGANKENADALFDLLGQIDSFEKSIETLNQRIQKQNDIINDNNKSQEEKQKAQEKLNKLDEERIKLQEKSDRYKDTYTQTTGRNYNNKIFEDASNAKEQAGLNNLIRSGGKGGNIKSAILNMGFDAVGDAVAGITTGIMKINHEKWMAEQDIVLNTLNTSSKLLQDKMKVFGSGVEKSLNSTLTILTSSIQENTYTAANATIDYTKDIMKMQLENERDILKYRQYNQLREKQKDVNINKILYDGANQTAKAINNVTSLFGPAASIFGGLLKAITTTTTKIMEVNDTLSLQKLQKRLEIAEKEMEALNNIVSTQVEMAMNNAKQLLNFSNTIETVIKKDEEQYKEFGKIYGYYNKAIENYLFSTKSKLKVTNSNGESKYLDINSAQRVQNQGEYVENSGKNIEFNLSDEIKQFGLGEILGSQGLAIDLTSGLDYFNKSVSNGSDILFSMYQNANRLGISNRKYAKDLVNNLKLAEKYTFRGGVQGMMKMALWAQNARFNMSSLSSMIDNVQEGGLEGVIKQGAQMQVLGGNVAMGADPLGMMYEAWNDPEAYAKRMYNMTRGLGRFNERTGEVELKGQDAMMVNAIAKAQGRSKEDVRNEINQRIKKEQVNRFIGNDLNEEQRALIVNKAQYENGRWKININGEHRDISEVTGEDLQQMIPYEKNIEDYVYNIYSLLKEEAGKTSSLQGDFIRDKIGVVRSESKERQGDIEEFFRNSNLEKIFSKSISTATDLAKSQYDNMISSTKIIDEQFDLMIENSKIWANTVQYGSDVLLTSIEAAKYKMLAYASDDETVKEQHNKKYFDLMDALMKMTGIGLSYKPNRDNTNETGFPRNPNNNNGTNFNGGLWGNAPSGVNQRNPAPWLNDGLIKNDNNSNYVVSSKVTPINDGNVTLAKTNPKDSAIFAKEGGPFDILFNGIFNKIDSVYDKIQKINPQYMPLDNFVKNFNTINNRNISFNNANNFINRNKNNDSMLNEYSYNFNRLFNGVFNKMDGVFNKMLGVEPQDIPFGEFAKNVSTINNKNISINNNNSALPENAFNSEELLLKEIGSFKQLFSSVDNRYDKIKTIEPQEIPFSEFAKSINTINNNNNNVIENKIAPIDVNINGKIELSNGNNNYDISEIIRNNPMLIRKITEMIVEQIGSNINGGKTTLFRNRYT